MHLIRNTVLVLACAALPALASAGTAGEGYYASARLVSADHRANDMSSSARPGIGQFVAGKDSRNLTTGALAIGYAWNNGWRTEGEYSLRRTSRFTSGSSTFATSFNHHHIRSQRLMANAYRDIELNHAWSVYGAAGIGLAQVSSYGWQGNESRQYGKQATTQLAWSLGAGISVKSGERTHVELGYRYADMGQTESGWNQFGNARGLQDERMRARLVSSEAVLGLRYAF